MKATALALLATSPLLLAINLAHAQCSAPLTEQFTTVQHLVDSLRPDKPGQARVAASDGSEYTAAQSLWMKGRIRFVRRACGRGDEASAAAALGSVSGLLMKHRRT